MKMLYRSALAVALVVSVAAVAEAQVPPTAPQNPPATPAPPVQDPFPGRSVEGPEALAPMPPARDEPWAFSFGVNGAYEGNALFTGPSEEDKEFSHMVQASIGRAWKLRRGDVQLGATAAQAFYQDTTSLNDFRYTIVGGLGHMITRRLTWSGYMSLSSGLARDSQVLTDAGTVLPSSTTAQTSTGTSLFTYALSPRSTVTWSLATAGVGFSSAAFNGGTNLNTAVTYGRQVGRGHTVGATVDYARAFADESSANVYGALGIWQWYAGASGWVISASGGIRPYDVPGETDLRMTSGVAAGVTKRIRRTQTVGITYAKSIEQAFGVREGNNLVQTVAAAYGFPLHRNVIASVSGTLTHSKDPRAAESSSADWGQMVQGGIQYRVLQNLSLQVGTAYYRRENEPAARITSTTTYITVAYNTTFR